MCTPPRWGGLCAGWRIRLRCRRWTGPRPWRRCSTSGSPRTPPPRTPPPRTPPAAEDVVVSVGDSVVLTGDGDATATAQDAVEGVEGVEDAAEEAPGIDPIVGGGARIGEGTFTSRYAGVMLLHPFLDRVGAAGVLSRACDRSPRRYDDLGVLTATCLSFALGTATVEAGKHLVRAQLGPAAGITALPELRTLRPRLAGLAEATDPLGLQRRLAAAMLGADAPGLGLYFVDDHFVPYAGAKPVPKGYNTKRRHAQRGRDDTVVCDYHARAVCFASGDPSGLSVTLPGALAQLREVLGPDAKIMLGFDRGGSYPAVFRACRDAGADWLTWRRGDLAPPAAAPVRSFRVGPAGTCEAITLADEMVEINGYGPARQLTLFEHDTPVLQILKRAAGHVAAERLGRSADQRCDVAVAGPSTSRHPGEQPMQAGGVEGARPWTSAASLAKHPAADFRSRRSPPS